MPIIDILSCVDGVEFTADTSVLNVQTNYFPVAGAVYDIFANGAYRQFQPKDNIIILSYGIFLPYCFTYGIVMPELNLAWWQDPNESLITQIAPPIGRVRHPTPRAEIIIDTYIPFDPPDDTIESTIGLNAITFNISMVGVPDDFDQEEIKIYPWIKVKHNLPLES